MSTYTSNLGITKLDPGQAAAHLVVNGAMDALDKAIAGRLAIDFSAGPSDTKTLAGGESTNAILHVISTPSACWLLVQAVAKIWTFINDGAHNVTVQCPGQTSPPTIAPGQVKMIVCDGTNVRVVS